ncbi:WbuC family cupin fold metalloprotein [Synechococcus sp. UW179B]|uniref:WbuC family cupin fold metalloprotein n=1 Tax=Synechococcus sp. UW179B TaxID=2575516 RepID=UPI001482F478|nr:WbuC family cupin fold metalloprotein [Synechococcus sp. UW179B]
MNKEAHERLKEVQFSKKGSKRLCFHKDKNSDLHAMLIMLKENAFYEEHRHQKDEMILLQEGEVEVRFKNEIVKLKMEENRLLIIEKGVLHSVKAGRKGATILEVIAHK